MMKYAIPTIIILLIAITACAPTQEQPPAEPTPGQETPGAENPTPEVPEPEQPEIPEQEIPPTPTPNMSADANPGRLVVTITDARADLSQIDSILVTFSEVEVLKGSGNWITVAVGPVTYDLLELDGTNTTMALSDMMLPAGTYTHIRFIISNITLTDINGTEHEAFLPGGNIKTDASFQLRKDDTSLIALDFLADESVHTASGRYIFAPVFKLETRLRASVVVDNGVAHYSGGIPKTVAKIGMDVNGNTGSGKNIPKNANIVIEDGRLKIKAGGTTTGWVTVE
jgi:hypothetical protein